MLKKFTTLAVAALFATGAFAQQTLDTAQDLLRTSGIEIEIPATATQDQIDRILAILGTSDMTTEDKEDQVKEILGLE